ncbi:LysR family transcriptional regulator [Radicibacter daui]|uniref:LysR family transcriptional regulator n=1 Tax=Radicibacter daui TaxID=3064829 RepID=UPI004046D823
MDMLRAMEVFVKVADAGSLTAAANDLGISATMVGNHLQALEEKLGARLVQRTTRRQSLTEFGHLYYGRCQDILLSVAEANAMAQEAVATPRGRLRITAPTSFGTARLVPALADYMDRFPEVELDIVFSDQVQDLVEGGFEAAIRLGVLPDSSLVARQLGPYRLVLCASPDYIARRGLPRHPRDLAQHDCLGFSFGARSEWYLARTEWPLRGPDGEHVVTIRPRLMLDNSRASLEAVMAGMGIAMLSEVFTAREVAAGDLVRVLPDYAFPPRPLHIVYLRDRLMSPKLRSFIDFVVERFGTAL